MTPSSWLIEAVSPKFPKAPTLFFSLLNTIISFDPVGWGVPWVFLMLGLLNNYSPISFMKLFLILWFVFTNPIFVRYAGSVWWNEYEGLVDISLHVLLALVDFNPELQIRGIYLFIYEIQIHICFYLENNELTESEENEQGLFQDSNFYKDVQNWLLTWFFFSSTDICECIFAMSWQHFNNFCKFLALALPPPFWFTMIALSLIFLFH